MKSRVLFFLSYLLFSMSTLTGQQNLVPERYHHRMIQRVPKTPRTPNLGKLEVGENSNCSDPHEHNNTIENATVLTQFPFVQENLCLTPGDIDIFQFELNGNSYYCSISSTDFFNDGAYRLSIRLEGDDVLVIQAVSTGETEISFDVTLEELFKGSLRITSALERVNTPTSTLVRYPILYPELEVTSRTLIIKESTLTGSITIKNVGETLTFAESDLLFSFNKEDRKGNLRDNIKSYRIPNLYSEDSFELNFRIDLNIDCPNIGCLCPGTYILEFYVFYHYNEFSVTANSYEFSNSEITIPETDGARTKESRIFQRNYLTGIKSWNLYARTLFQ